LKEQQSGPIPYIHKCQWDDGFSPMRISFLSDDPSRGNRSISVEGGGTIVQGRVPQPNTVSIRIGWREAFTLIERIEKDVVDPYFDRDAQMMVSAYRLLDAGVINDRVQVQGIADISEGRARMCFMMRYEDALSNCIADPSLRDEMVALARLNLSDALNWLAGVGMFPIRPWPTKN
jgi:hypothetical protein